MTKKSLLIFLLSLSVYLVNATISRADFTDSFTAPDNTPLTTYNSAYHVSLGDTASTPIIQNNQLKMINNNGVSSSTTVSYTLSDTPSSYCVQGDFIVPDYTQFARNWNLGSFDFAGYNFIMNMDNITRNSLQYTILQDNPFDQVDEGNTFVGLPAVGSTMTLKGCNNNGELTMSVNGTQIFDFTGRQAPTGTQTLTIGTTYTDEFFDNLDITNTTVSSPTPTPTPIPAQNTITISPSTSTVTVGTPFNATVVVNGGQAFNAAQAHIAVSSNLSITGIHSAPSPTCNLQYTQTPTLSDPSFAGAIYGSSSTNCNVYTLTLTPNATGTGNITITNGSIKSYANNSEIITGVTNGSYTINAAGATPTPTPPLSGLTVTSPTETYNSTYTLTGTKDANTTTIFVNGSSTGVTYPTNTTWQATETLTLGANNTAGSNIFTIYGSDGTNQTPTISSTVSLHELGDINGDGHIDLTDASLFAVDWGKTSGLTYPLSDMNGDGSVDLTDLSILAKLEAQ